MTYAVGSMIRRLDIPRVESHPELLGKMFPKISYALSVEWGRMSSLPSRHNGLQDGKDFKELHSGISE